MSVCGCIFCTHTLYLNIKNFLSFYVLSWAIKAWFLSFLFTHTGSNEIFCVKFRRKAKCLRCSDWTVLKWIVFEISSTSWTCYHSLSGGTTWRGPTLVPSKQTISCQVCVSQNLFIPGNWFGHLVFLAQLPGVQPKTKSQEIMYCFRIVIS